MIYSLSNFDIALIIAASGAVVLGIIFLFLAGVHRVKKGYCIIVEKVREYYATYYEGWHFKFPIIYQRVGLYCLVPQVRRYVSEAGNKLSITFKIEDPKTYHYKGINFETLMKVIEKENDEITLTVLKDKFHEYGLEFINIQKVAE